MSDFNAMDLDSLDALLDAAEIEAVSENESSEDTPDTAEPVATDDTDDGSAALAESLSAVPETVSVKAPEQEKQTAVSEEAQPVPVATQPPTPAPTQPPTPPPTQPPEAVSVIAPTAIQQAPVAAQDQPKPTLQPEVEVPTDAPKLAKSNKKQPANTETWTEAEMDSIKKLIIIFSSIIIVLVLAAIGIGLGGLFSTAATDPKLVETVDGIKNDVGQGYLITEDSGKQLKTMGTQLSDVATQLADISELIETLKKTQPVAHAAPAASNKQMSAAERKAAMREEIQANANHEATDNADTGESVNDKSEKFADSAQVKAIAVDILDVKKRLIVTQKLLELINKQSEALQLQSLTLTEAVKAVEVEVKSHNKPPVKVTSVAPKAVVEKKVEDKPVAPPVQLKPADDPQFRARWSREMGKSDGFP